MGDYLSFRKMIAPVLIKILFWIVTLLILFCILGSIGMGIYTMSEGRRDEQKMMGCLMCLAGPIIGVVYVLMWRVVCEFWLVFFEMNDRLREVSDALTGHGVPHLPPPPPMMPPGKMAR